MPTDAPKLSERLTAHANVCGAMNDGKPVQLREGLSDGEGLRLDLEDDLRASARIVSAVEVGGETVEELLEMAQELRRSAKAAHPDYWEHTITAKFAEQCEFHAADMARLARVRALIEKWRADTPHVEGTICRCEFAREDCTNELEAAISEGVDNA